MTMLNKKTMSHLVERIFNLYFLFTRNGNHRLLMPIVLFICLALPYILDFVKVDT
jgi:hypothetical protein